jgi:ABC-type sugar transport system substrate-binding protein
LLYVCGTVGTSSAQIRLDGVRAALAGRNIHMVLAQGDWSSASGSAAVQHWLRTRITTVKACVVGAQNDTMAISARAALVSGALELKQPELMDVPVTGCDGTPAQGQACVRSHELRATVVIPSSADRAVDELASAFASGRSPEADIVLDVASFPDISSIESPKVPRATAQSFGPHSKASTARG